MRNLILIGLVVGGAFAAGWFTVNRDGDRTTIEFNRAEIRKDTRRAIDKGREILDRGDQQIADSGDPGYRDDSYGYDPRLASQNASFPPAGRGDQRPVAPGYDYGQLDSGLPGYPPAANPGATYQQYPYQQPPYQANGYRDARTAPWNQNAARPGSPRPDFAPTDQDAYRGEYRDRQF